MEHNHSNLIIRFMLSFFMFGVGMSLGLFSRSGGDLQSQLVILVSAIFLLKNPLLKDILSILDSIG